MFPLIKRSFVASERDPKLLRLSGNNFVSTKLYKVYQIAPKVSCNHPTATNRDRKIKADGFIDSLFAFERQLSTRNNRLKEGLDSNNLC